MLRNPDVVAAFQLRNDLGDGGLGVDGAESVTPMALEALDVVEDGVAWRLKDQREIEAREVAAKAGFDDE